MNTLNTIIEEVENPSYYQAIISNPQWEAWGKVAHEYGFDLHESVECGWLSPKHFEAFLKFVAARARTDWLRSEIEKLEGIRLEMDDCFKNDPFHPGNAYRVGHDEALDSIITRYKEELKVLESK